MSSTISVTGHARRKVRPDRVEFHFTFGGVLPSVGEAEQFLARQRGALLEALARERNFTPRTTTSGPSIRPHHVFEKDVHVFKGFKAAESIRSRFDLAPGLVSSILHLVAHQLPSLELDVHFSARHTSAALRAARAEAVRDAKRKATHLATAAEHRLGRLILLSDTPPLDGPARHFYSRTTEIAEEKFAAEIDPENQRIEVEVHGVWELVSTLPAGHV